MEIDVSNYDCLKFAYSSIYFRYYTHSPASYSTSLSNNNNDHSIRYKWITRELFMFLWQCLKVLANCNCSCPSKGTTRVARECLHVIDALSEWCGWVCEYNVSDCVKAFQFSAIVPGGAFYLFLTERRMVTQWKECVGVDDDEEVMLPSDKRRIVINC